MWLLWIINSTPSHSVKEHFSFQPWWGVFGEVLSTWVLKSWTLLLEWIISFQSINNILFVDFPRIPVSIKISGIWENWKLEEADHIAYPVRNLRFTWKQWLYQGPMEIYIHIKGSLQREPFLRPNIIFWEIIFIFWFLHTQNFMESLFYGIIIICLAKCKPSRSQIILSWTIEIQSFECSKRQVSAETQRQYKWFLLNAITQRDRTLQRNYERSRIRIFIHEE